MKKIIIIDNIHQAAINILKKRKDFSYEVLENFDLNILKEKIKDCDAIALKVFKLNKEILESTRKLKVISKHGVGYDNIDLDAVKNKKITLTITKNANSVSVAEHIFSMILNISKGINAYDKCVKDGNFSKKHELLPTQEISDKKILIVGFGSVTKKLIKRCLGFEMKVYIYDPNANKEIIDSFGCTKIDNLDKGLKEADIVSLNVPLNKNTHNMINMEKIKIMKKNSIIINTSRGGIVNEKDLNEALDKNMIFGAGLDVFENEPPEIDNPLLKNNRVLLSPHAAALTEECKKRTGEDTIQNIIDFFDGKLNKASIVNL